MTARRRSRWIDTLTRTLLRLLAIAGLLAMLPALHPPQAGRFAVRIPAAVVSASR